MSKNKMKIGSLQTPHSAGKSQNNKKIILGIIGFAVILFAALQIISIMMQKNTETITSNSFIAPQGINASNSSTQQLGDDFYKAASNGAAIPQQADTQPKPAPAQTKSVTSPTNTTTKAENPADKLVTVSLSANIGRVHPFVPSVALSSYSRIPRTPAATFPAPPIQLIPNETAIKLMETTISGIMYDALSPSAIISVEGQDHLVRKGDRINGYKIVNITKDRVIVQNGTNVYRATVGETLTTENSGITFNNVYNLQKKFGGSGAPNGTKMIQIN